MKRLSLLLFLFLFSFPLFSQLDVLHYVPPLYGRTNVQNHYMILSTPSTAAVTVDVKNGQGTIIYSTVITDVAPNVTLLGTGYASPGIINTAELNTILATDGFIVEASAPIYVNLRHVQNAQGLSLNSKGANTGLGTRFRSGHIFSSAALPHVKAHEISVMATEDNTTVTFSEIKPGVIFRNTPTTAGTSDDITVTLNAGESYCIAAWVNEAGATNNVNGVNGTLVTSDKPIACNTGSWLSGAHGNLRDIGVDQIVPADLIGQEYIFVEGDGNANTERPLVVAEYDNTQIFVNGNAVPVATINAGDYFYLPQSSYSANDNIYIETSQPVFMYQSLSGASPAATSLNFIPPLRCNGFKKVVIPSVNLVGTPTVSITARTNANVFINGSATPLTGGLTVPGNDCWVTYKIPGGTGDFVVESDSIINVALLTLQGPRGSAGYFTGFTQFTQLDQGDTSSFIVCVDSASSFVTYSIGGPYIDVTAEFSDPALNGEVIIDGFNEDTLYFTYVGDPNTLGPDTLELTACKLLECCGAIPDTVCEVTTLVFTNIADIEVGLGDSITACADTSNITMEDLLLGNFDPNGYWVDTDNSGALFGNSFDVSAVPPGIYHFTYYVDGGSICYDSTVVEVEVLGMETSTCCSIAPDFVLTDPTCNGFTNGSIVITDDWATLYSLDGGTTTQGTGSFNTIGANAFNVNLTFGPDCVFDTTIVLTEPDVLDATFTVDSVSCNGLCDGEILTHTTGGTAPYEFSLGGAPAQSDSTYTGLCAGPATITITDTNNCQAVFANTVLEPDVLELSEAAHTDETCTLGNGEVTLAAAGGTLPYSFTVDAGAPQASPIFSNLSEGTYTFEVTDANGCTDQIIIDIIDSPSPIPVVDVLNDVTCAGGLNGSVTIAVTGGTAPLSFSLDAGPGQASNTFGAVGAGNHTVTVTDANGCTGDVDFTINQPTILQYNTTVTDASCNGLCNGWIAIDASGAVPPYQYSDDNGLTFQALDTLQNLCAGNVNVVVSDANGCLANSIETINEPTALTSAQGFVDPVCHQTPTGEISFAPAGGTPGYQFSVDNGANFLGASPITGLMAGVYDVIVEDANGCQFTEQVTLTDPPPFDFIFIANNPSNCGASDGSFEIIATSGTAPYEYSIDGGTTWQQSNGFFGNLFSGLYNLVAMDDNGCMDSTFSALSDNVMTGFIDGQINSTCHNSCDGMVSVTQNFGAPPFTYTLSTTGVSQVNNGFFDQLCPGTHYVTIEDAGSCLEIVQVDITHPDSVTFDTTLVNITCPDGADGAVTITNPIGGDGGPYTYSIDGVNFGAANTFNGLTSGTYTVWTEDGQGCLGSSTFTLTEPDPWDININSTNLVCNNDNTGFIQIVGDGGTGPYQYDLVTVGTNATGIFPGLAAATYDIVVTDDLGCTFDTLQMLTEPLALLMANALTDPVCYGSSDGQINVTAVGGTQPYLYSPNNGVSLQSSNVLTGLADGCYDVFVQDNSGCTISSNECLNEPTLLTMTFTTNPETCENGNGDISITAGNGTPGYDYSINGGTSFQAGNIFNGLTPGTYDLVLMDSEGCTIDSTAEVMDEPEPVIDNVVFTNPLCFGGNEGTITITSSSGVGGHQYSLDGINYQGSNVFNTLADGTYDVYVQDANGCVVQTQVVLTEPDVIVINTTPTHLLCFEDNSGAIDMTATGGTIPYQFSIDNGANFQGAGNFSGLAIGTYDLMVEDGNGCQITSTVDINEPNPLQFDPFTIDSASCYGFCDGVVTANVIGGTIGADYSYTWSGVLAGTVGNTANTACEGTYSLVVEDDNGCTIDTLNFYVGEPEQAIIDSVVLTGVSCWGDSDGIIEIYSANSGFYSIGLGFSPNNTFNGLPTGIYTAYVQDANGCPGDSAEVFVSTPQDMQAFVTPDEYICQGDTIYFSIVATGGTQPYVFDINNGTTNQEYFESEIFSDTSFYATVTDANGCSVESDTMYIYVAPPPILITANDTVICLGEPLELFSEADDLVETYTYLWDTGETDPFIYPNVTSDTTFYVTVTDECNVSTDDSISVTLFDDPIVTLTPDITGGCPPFQINYTIGVDQNDLGSDLFWTSTYGTIDSSNFTNIYVTYDAPGAGGLNLSFTSSNGCQVDTTFANLVNIFGLPEADFVITPNPPSIYDTQVNLTNTSTDYETNWWYYMGDTVYTEHSMIDVLDLPLDTAVTVCLIVENNFGCTDTACQVIELENEQFMFVPNAILLDGFSNNSVFKPVTNYFHPDFYQLEIFNRWGELIFETNDLDVGWDGTYNGVMVQDGVYVWKITGAPLSNDADLKKYFGHVTVLK